MIEHEQYYRKGGTYELPIEIYNDLIGQIEEAQKERNNYKSRCEKAIEYIKMYKCDYYPYELTDSAIRNVLNILNGSDENE